MNGENLQNFGFLLEVAVEQLFKFSPTDSHCWVEFKTTINNFV
jgi:hypothetical protein